jgi:hypothetical protein
VQVTCDTTILGEQLTLYIAVNELLVEAVTLSSLGISLGDVVDSNRLRTVSSTNPVGIGEVDTDSSRGIAVTCKDSSSDNLSRYTCYVLFFEASLCGRVIFKPLSVFADKFGTA